MNPASDNPEKGQLLQKSAHHRQLLEEEVKFISERSEKILTNALVIGGALALTYFLISGISGKAGKKRAKERKIGVVENKVGAASSSEEDEVEDTKAGFVSQIGAVIAAQATAFLLSIAREKIVEFLESQAAMKGKQE
jgi:hypothetical protein